MPFNIFTDERHAEEVFESTEIVNSYTGPKDLWQW